MRSLIKSAAIVLVAIACAEPGTPTAPAIGLSPSERANVGGDAVGNPLIDGACLRDTGKPFEVAFEFSGADGGAATLKITDNGVLGLNGTITLNGEVVVTHPMLGGNAPVDLSVPVTTASSNVLVCKLEGKPGSGLSFTVTQ